MTSPHVAGLLAALLRRGMRVTYVAETPMSAERLTQGWAPPEPDGVRQHFVRSPKDVESVISAAGRASIHVCDGVRGGGLASVAQRVLAGQGFQQWVSMEAVDDQGMWGVAKRLEYRRLFRALAPKVLGVLAIGADTPQWVQARGVPAGHVFPFAYFLPARDALPNPSRGVGVPFGVTFVGQLIPRKRVDLLIRALARLDGDTATLTVVGAGESETALRSLAESILPRRVAWKGSMPMAAAQHAMTQTDCLVLPSRHDGWGAVVSEALMAGTPVICSDRCGAKGVVEASGWGGVFRSGDVDSLEAELRRAITRGRPSVEEREAVARWARCLGAEAGAEYLLQILDHADGLGERPQAPWLPDRSG